MLRQEPRSPPTLGMALAVTGRKDFFDLLPSLLIHSLPFTNPRAQGRA